MTKQSPSAPMQQNTPAIKAGAQKPVNTFGLPIKQGMYDPRNEHDACGVGFVAHMEGVKSHQIVKDGLFMLENLTHRGAVGSDPLMGDGAGMLMQIPHTFFKEELAKDGVTLPDAGHYGVGYYFLTQDDVIRGKILDVIKQTIQSEGLKLLAIRDVPVDNSSLSKDPLIAATEPVHLQIFVERDASITDDDEY
jgi:glutamate synthase (NADPH/NADH) large chain